MKPFGGVDAAEQRSLIVGFLKACSQCDASCPAPKKCQPQPE